MKAFMLFIAMGLIAVSTEARELTLREALSLAQSHAFELKKADANRSAAETVARAAGAERMPTLSSNSVASYVSDVSQLRLELPTTTIEREIGTHETYQTDLRLTLPIWSGGRISSAIALANAQKEYAEQLARVESDRVAYQTRLEYFNVQIAEKGAEVAKSSLSRAMIIERDVQSLYEAGAADSVNIVESALAMANARNAVEVASTSRRLAEIRLLTLCGLSDDETITHTDKLANADSLAVLAEQLRPKESDRSELSAAATAISIQKSRVSQSGSEWFPTLSGYGGYSYGKPNLDRFGNSWNDYWTVGATLNWSLNLGGKTKYRTAAARFDLVASQSDEQRIAEQLAREVRLAVERLKLSAKLLATARERLRLSGETFRLAQEQQREGSLSSNRLMEIETRLTETELSAATAEIELYAAWSTYLYAIGSPQLTEGL